jgi:ABC-type sugar transport system permease subunit
MQDRGGARGGLIRWRGSSRLAPYLYVLPALAALALWNYYPLVFLVDLSLHRLDASSPIPT